MSKDPILTSAPPDDSAAAALSERLAQRLRDKVRAAGGWLGFDAFMAEALYAPGLGYYANGLRKFGHLPGSGSDFVTAPELSPLFGQTLAAQVGEMLARTGTGAVWEFGAGSGALALQLLDTLGEAVQSYTIVELSASLRERQQAALAGHAGKVVWADALPERLAAVVVGNEVLDAMPVQLLARVGGVWHERGVALDGQALVWADRPTDLRPPLAIAGSHDYVTEIHPQAEAFIATLAERLDQGAALFIDYGFPEAEYYHAQRHMGTLICHRAHQTDADPLGAVGLKDITAHVNFTGLALAAQDAGLSVLGYTSQARFLMNCGLLERLVDASLAQRAMAQKLLTEHEMGELFKVMGFFKGDPWEPLGFALGDRCHTL